MPMKISCIPRLFSISHSNYNKNKRSSQCDCWRKSKHSKCRYTCEKRRGLTGIYLQSSKQILCGPTPEKQSAPADHRNALFSFLGKSQALIYQEASLLQCPPNWIQFLIVQIYGIFFEREYVGASIGSREDDICAYFNPAK